MHGGRGGSKSNFFAEQLILKANSTLGLHWVCLREVQKSLEQSVKRLLEQKIAAFDLNHRFRILDTEIRGPGDGLIIFQGMQNHTAASIKSLESYDGAWFEEAQMASKHSWRILRPTLRKSGSEIWASWNPQSAEDPVDAFFRGPVAPPRSVCIEVNWMDNPYFPPDLKEEKDWDLAYNTDEYGHIWLGEYQHRVAARVFRNWRIEPFETPSDARLYFGADWGYANDPTVLVRCWLQPNLRKLFVDYEARAVNCEIENTPALFDLVPGSRRWPITADSARPETISYMRRQGFYIDPAVKGPGSVEEGIEWLKNFTIVVHPRCIHLSNELATYAWKVDKHTEKILPQLEDKNNHEIDGLRYACEALIRKKMSVVDML